MTQIKESTTRTRKPESLTPRQREILRLVLQEYIRTGHPVGSQALVERYRLPYSSATVRNEFAALTRAGYLTQPHTSAGRIPTPRAYRFLVQHLDALGAPPLRIQEAVRQRLRPQNRAQDWLVQAAEVLAEHTHTAAWVTPPRLEQARCQGVRLMPWEGNRVLVLVALPGGWIHQRVVGLTRRVPPSRLAEWQRYLTERCRGRTARELASLPPPQDPDVRRLWEVVLDEVDRAQSGPEAPLYRRGLQYLVLTEAAPSAVRVLEESTRLRHILRQVAARLPVGEVHVLIGGTEDAPDELQGCAFIVGRYGARAPATGYLGVVGPLRMPYNETVPAVRFVSRWLTRLFSES